MKKIFKNYIVRKVTIETKRYISNKEILSENTDKEKVLEEFLTGKYKKPNDNNDNLVYMPGSCITISNYGSIIKDNELLSLEEDYEVIEVK